MSISSLHGQALTLVSLMNARRLMARLNTREKLERHQAAKLHRFMKRVSESANALASFRNKPFSEWPKMDKAALMQDFAAYNRLRLSTVDAWKAYESGEPPKPGYAVGASTGTSGNKGLYVISSAERYKWLGVILSRALPDILKTRHRVAVVLPAASRLYDAANESRRLVLKFFDLTSGIDAQLAPVAEFNPTILVAPPKVLRAFAEAGIALSCTRIFSGAEVLSPEDRDIIESRFGQKVREIYMATEGLFGVACEAGTLHLLEDHLFFEWEDVAGSSTLAAPVITDFSRRTQMMVRYRMNDLLELQTEPCPCGSPYQAVKAIHGRSDDVFHLARSDGSLARITPDVIRNAVIAADRAIEDFRVRQTGHSSVEVLLPEMNASAAGPVSEGLRSLFSNAGASPDIHTDVGSLSVCGDKKLRRVSVEKHLIS